MKKYNLSNIMKRAWELVKKSAMTISSGLKKAWREAKTMEYELVELVGSPKQIAWAEDIRKKMVEYWTGVIKKYEVDRPVRAEKRKKEMGILCNIKEAKWFIENRNYAYAADTISPQINHMIEKQNEMEFYKRLYNYVDNA